MTWIDVVIVCLSALAVVGVLATAIYKKVKGKTGCGGGCGNCSACGGCALKKDEEK